MSSSNRTNIPNSLNEHWMPFTDNKSFKKNPRLITDAKGVYLTSLGNANFSDNYFDLSSNEEKTIILPVAKNQNYSELIKSIELISLWDSFN